MKVHHNEIYDKNRKSCKWLIYTVLNLSERIMANNFNEKGGIYITSGFVNFTLIFMEGWHFVWNEVETVLYWMYIAKIQKIWAPHLADVEMK